MTFSRYARYKESGMSWLGEIPAHWEIKKAKFLWQELEERSVDGNEQLLSVSQYSGVIPREEDSRSDNLANYKKCSVDDLVINIMLAWMGGLGIAEQNGIVSPAYSVYRQKDNNNSKYFGYLYRTSIYLAEFARRSTGVVPSRWRMYTEDFGQVLTLVPPLEEQERIAGFLDEKVGEITTAVAQKQRLIDLLQEQKEIMINTAVTRGLNPHVPLKESGIPWLGKIPAHWEVKRIKFIADFITSGPRGWAEYYSDSGSYFLQSGNLNNDVGIELENAHRVTPPRGAGGIRTRLENDDVLVCVTGANTGRVGIAKLNGQEVYINQHLSLVRPNKSMYADYLAYILSSHIGKQHFSLAQYGLKEGLNLSDVRNAPIFLPPIDEQIRIAEYVGKTIQQFKNMQGKIQLHIDKLHEYKQVLIAAAVTGQLKL